MAVEEEILGQVVSGAAGFGSSAFDILFYILIGGIILALGWVVWWILQHKHKIVVRYLTKRGAFIIEDKARTVNRSGVIYWKFLKGKIETTPPPKKAINITKKGKLYAECYITEDNPEPVWLVDTGYKKSFDKDGNYKPVTTQERALIVSRIRKAEERRGKNLWEQITQIAIPTIMLGMVIIPFVFWGDITKTSTDALQQADRLQEQNADIAESNARILAVMAGKIDTGELDIKQDIPPDADISGGGS